jgi:ubiquinone/menaquinone biosynthesis C-methylase UbiE
MAAAGDAWAKQAQNDIMWTITEPHVRAAMSRVDVPEGATVLDIAAGTGSCAIPLALRSLELGRRVRILATDLSPGMLDVLASNASSAGVGERIERRVMNAEQLDGVADASCDVVVCMFALMFIAPKAKVAAEFARVLKPGGRLVLTTWKSAGSVSALPAILSSAGKDPAAVAGLEAVVYSLATPQQIEEAVRPAGFTAFSFSEHEERYDLGAAGPLFDRYVDTFIDNPCISMAFAGIPRDDVAAAVRGVLSLPGGTARDFTSLITYATRV